MKKIIIFISAILCFLSCKQDECSPISSESCDRSSLVVINPNSRDLFKFILRPDTFTDYKNLNVNAVKSVPGQGEIEWVGNNGIIRFISSGECYLSIANYVDTTWRDLESWAFLREVVLTKFDPCSYQKQKIFDESAYLLDNSKNYSRYIRNFDDVVDAEWYLDTSEDNWIQVTKLDKNTKIAEGEFLLHFRIKTKITGTGNTYSDKVNFRCGRFKAKIFER